MNIENIEALSTELQRLGFEQMKDLLAKRIAFRPATFSIQYRTVRNKADLNFYLFFERQAAHEKYSLMYYDAIFRLESTVVNNIVNGIEVGELERSMRNIDWQDAFDLNSARKIDSPEKEGFEKWQKVESVIDALQKLEQSEEGKAHATNLKLKYWEGFAYQDAVGAIIPVKDKSEISQRFYLLEDQAGISIDEACRFLHNRWQEKQLNLKKKEVATDDSTEASNSSAGKSLLQKKRAVIKKNNPKTSVK